MDSVQAVPHASVRVLRGTAEEQRKRTIWVVLRVSQVWVLEYSHHYYAREAEVLKAVFRSSHTLSLML